MIVIQKDEVEGKVEDLLYRTTQKSLHTRCLTWRPRAQGTLAPPLFKSQTFLFGVRKTAVYVIVFEYEVRYICCSNMERTSSVFCAKGGKAR